MDDETLFSYMREMMTEQIKTAYADELKKQMSQLSTASLAEAFDNCYLTDEGYKLIYDELNQGQRKKLLRNAAIKALYERYGIGGNDE